MRVALVYDRVNKWGGAERILLALHELFPDAPLYTSVYNPLHASWAKVFTVKTSFLQSLHVARGSHEYFALAMPLAFESFDFSNYDVVISITSEAAKGILTPPRVKHISYCLTPTRYLWSGHDEYFRNPIVRFLAKPAVSYLRHWDTIAANRPDFFIAISQEVKGRIKKYYQKEASVIYPPLALPEGDTKRKKGKYFLVVSRMVPYKRIDLAIKACNQLEIPLKIVGTGGQLSYLRKIAGPTVEFLGNLTDLELVEYYKGCQGLIFPGKEDFGLTILEAQKYGKPVIAFKAGGALETVRQGKTGLFFYPQTMKALMYTMQRFMKKKFDPKLCKKQAAQFSKERFKDEFLTAIGYIMNTNP
ncbi:MAG: glycosyltransferase [Candidatus Levybacteria bacterium]|nr:glycosyltransferase [Candidatus Levybacteria bacterium]